MFFEKLNSKQQFFLKFLENTCLSQGDIISIERYAELTLNPNIQFLFDSEAKRIESLRQKLYLVSSMKSPYSVKIRGKFLKQRDDRPKWIVRKVKLLDKLRVLAQSLNEYSIPLLMSRWTDQPD